MSKVPKLIDGEQKVFFKAAGDWCYLWTPETFKQDEPIPVVMQHHGNGGYVREGTADWLLTEPRGLAHGFDPDFKIKILNAVMRGGDCAVAGSHACGNHWGNPCSVEANSVLYDALVASPQIDSERVGMVGGGLGGLLIWNSVAGPLSGKIKAVAVMQSVVSIEATIREQKFKAQLLEAFDLPGDMPDDEAVAETADSDSLPKLQRLASGTPLPTTGIYHGAVDDNIPAETNAIPLAEALRKAGGDVTLNIFPKVGHNVYFMGKAIEDHIEAFFAENL